MAYKQGGFKGCLLILVLAALMGGVGYFFYTANQASGEAFRVGAGRYLDALIAEDFSRAAEADHPERNVSAIDLREGWSTRTERLGKLKSWSVHTTNSGVDSDGSFLQGKVILTFSEVDYPVPVRIELRDIADGAEKRLFRMTLATRTQKDEAGAW